MARRQTLMAYAVAKVGPMKAAHVLAFMIAWEVARQALGDEWPAEGVEAQILAYTDWWREHERTGWREIARFRACFEHERTPTRLMELVREQWNARRGVRGLGAVDVPIEVVG